MNDTYKTILAERAEGGVGVVRLNRPDALNALNSELMEELLESLLDFEADPEIRCVVVTGNERAFAAGADISEMAEASLVDVYLADNLSLWDGIAEVKTPIVAAVDGWCLGGGCELAMICDVVIASQRARFGQPEIKIGVIPGAGGTQRLTRAIGKSRAMELVLTGEPMDADEALSLGLVSRVVPPETLMDEALRVAGQIASMPPVAVQLAKDAVNRAYESPLAEGVRAERRNFLITFATEDRKEGMDAFVNKRKPTWKGR